jgi:hypothetical protein
VRNVLVSVIPSVAVSKSVSPPMPPVTYGPTGLPLTADTTTFPL